MEQDVAERMRALAESRPTKSQRRLLDYFQAGDRYRFADDSLSGLAKKLDLAPMTVLRFCRALGYDGYGEFRQAILQETRIDADMGWVDSLKRQYCAEIARCAESLSEVDVAAASRLIAGASSVCCCAFGALVSAARELHGQLLGMGIPSHFEGDGLTLYRLLSSRGVGDVLVLFETERSMREAADAAVLARANGMKVVAAVCGEHSPLRRYADVALMTSECAGRIGGQFTADAIFLALSRAQGAPCGREAFSNAP